VTREGLPRYLELGFSPPCIVVSPQLFAFTQKWTPDVVLPVLDDVVARYRVDPDRVTLLGVSSGASTGWEVLKAAPHRFAAFVPIAGWTTTGCVQRMTNVAVWGVYGGLDFVAPPFLAARGIKAHQACGGDARITVVPAMSHWVSQGVYESSALWAWILSQRRKGDASSQHGDSV
jgi:predicted peptidase